MFRPIFGCLLTLGCTLSGIDLHAQGRGELLVVNQGDRTLSVIDPGSGDTIASIPVGGVTGHEVAVSPDGRTAFVPIYGDSGVGRPGTDGHSVAVIDLSSHRVRASVDFPHGVRPHCPVFDAAHHLLYVTTELDQTVSLLDPKTLKLTGALPTGAPQSHMLVLSHDGRTGYTANVGSGTVSVLDLSGHAPPVIIPVAPSVQRIAISNDDRLVFTADQAQPRLAVIDTASRRVTRWIPLPDVGYGTAVTPDGRYLLVALRGAGKLSVVDLRTLSVVRTLDVGRGPVEIRVRHDAPIAYVSCSPDAAVAELAIGGDVRSWHLHRMIKAGAGADGLAWVP